MIVGGHDAGRLDSIQHLQRGMDMAFFCFPSWLKVDFVGIEWARAIPVVPLPIHRQASPGNGMHGRSLLKPD